MPAKIKTIAQGSLAYKAGLRAGDVVEKINGRELVDILDYMYLSSSEDVELQLAGRTTNIHNEEYAPLGIEFETTLIDAPRRCHNKCVFCFIDQLPCGMREAVYFRDDDYRLSFLQGNYISLTNLTERDIEKIIEYNLPRINVSVHTTNPELRVEMLNNRYAGGLMNIMRRFCDNKNGSIHLNCQIVLCREYNDGAELDRTILDLAELHENIQSVSVVPVGLTAHREGLTGLKPFDKQSSIDVIEQVECWQEKLFSEIGTRFVFLGDEFYVMAERNFPKYEYYEDFLQIENGVGLMASFLQEYDSVFEKGAKIKNKKAIITGSSAYNFIKELTDRFDDNGLSVFKIKNNFFGESITVTGLITGQDIIEQLKGRDYGNEILIPSCMLRYEDDVFLDDISVNDIERELGVSIKIVPVDGAEFYWGLVS